MKSETAINWPIAICLIILIGFVTAMNYGLNSFFGSFGFWPGMALCVGGFLLTCLAAYAYDRRVARSQERPPQGPSRHQP